MTFARYAVYYLPDPAEDWARFATAWLGWDAETGLPVDQPQVPGLDLHAITQTPSRYGLHATLKPPFRLASDVSLPDLHQSLARLAARLQPIETEGLALGHLGRFLALRPVGSEAGINALASACVRDLDPFRAPASEAELAKRRKARLSATQDSNLVNWGYPYVHDDFRFHITLTGRLAQETLIAAENALSERLGPFLPEPFRISDLALMGEDTDGRFHLIERFALG